tara:strand:- start:9 stop:425 length:417 start_codon:yes stop_codon:yes gene_type:complete
MVEGTIMGNFDDFWAIYPRKKEKKRAKNYFNKLTKKTQLECIEGVKMYIKQIEAQGTEKQFIKHPSTFINGENWEDEFEIEVVKVKKLKATDYKTDTTENSRLGYCSSCGKHDFYDKFKIHLEKSLCCGKSLDVSRRK